MSAIPHEPTDEKREQIEKLSALGVTSKDIALFVGIGEKTLRKYYRYELDIGFAAAKMTIAGKLYDKAVAGDMTAIIFYLKTKGGFNEKGGNEEDSFGSSIVPTRRVIVGSKEEAQRLEHLIEQKRELDSEDETRH
jgi:hypothetical protein